jgi:hypothetical protein
MGVPDLQPGVRVVVPYVGEVHPDTLAGVDGWPGGVSYHDVSGSDTAYAELLRELWREQEGFCIVEGDVVPLPWTLAEFAVCPEPYCAAPYALEAFVGVALGCTRFSSLFLRCYPDAAEIAARIPSPFGEPGHWRQLDVWLQGAVLRDEYGWQPHAHAEVMHRNPARELSPAAQGLPVRTRVEGRMYLEPGTVDRIAADLAGSASER